MSEWELRRDGIYAKGGHMRIAGTLGQAADAHNVECPLYPDNPQKKELQKIDEFFQDPNGHFMVEGNTTFDRVQNYTVELDGRIDELEETLRKIHAGCGASSIRRTITDWVMKECEAALKI